MRVWISAMRLRTLPLAAASVLTGLAVTEQKSDRAGLTFVLILLTTFLLQILSNLANDYGDSINGADNDERIGPARAVQSGQISPKRMRTAVVITATLSFTTGIAVLYLVFKNQEGVVLPLSFVILGLAAIAAAVKYTAGKNPYGYRGLGDLFVLIFFGVAGVMGTHFLVSSTFELTTVFPALACGLFATAVLNLNNLRDHQNDEKTGKRTLVVHLGYAGGCIYHRVLFVSAWSLLLAWLIFFNDNRYILAAIAVIPLHVKHLKKVHVKTAPKDLDPELKKVALSALLLSLILLAGSLF